MNKNELYTIRDYNPETDKNFIFSTLLIGLYYGGSPFSMMKKQTFMENYHKVLEALLVSSNTSIRVACAPDEPYVVYGYAILTKPDAVHWCFVKKDFRGAGIARDLVPPTTKTFTTYTKVGLSIAKKKELAFNPFLF